MIDALAAVEMKGDCVECTWCVLVILNGQMSEAETKRRLEIEHARILDLFAAGVGMDSDRLSFILTKLNLEGVLSLCWLRANKNVRLGHKSDVPAVQQVLRQLQQKNKISGSTSS